MFTNLRVVGRRLAKTPGFTLTALVTLALCIGANLTIFAVVDGLLVRPLPFARADRLVTLYYVYPKLSSAGSGASLTNYYERRGQIPALASLAEFSGATSVVGETGTTSIENLGRVTPEFFAALGVKPLIGRAFKDEEMTYSTDHVVILSYEFWHSRFQADPRILGQNIRLDGLERTIVGILPPHFRFLSFQAPIYMPLSSEEGERNIGARHNLGKTLIGRLADGATVAEAQAQVNASDAAHAAEFPQAQLVAEAGCRTVVAPLQSDYVAGVRPTLIMLQAGALFLLLIGCVNLVNLLLIRASSRARELAIRQALGASQRHLVGEVMTETILLSVTGALLGLGVGALGIKLLTALGAGQLPLGAQIAFDARLAAAALLGALLCGIAVGLPICWAHLHDRLALALQAESRGSTTGRATQHLRHGFIVTQIALAFVLLTGAGLLGLSLQRAMAVSPGFRPDHVITGQFNLPWSGYHDINSFDTFFVRFYDQARSLPGISAVGAVSNVPVQASNNEGVVTVPGYQPRPGKSIAMHDVYAVAGDYFRAIGIPLRAGRFLGPEDALREPPVCVVDEVFARYYWPNGGAIGKLVYKGTDGLSKDNPPFTVVGVVGAIKQASLTDEQARGAVYFSYRRIFIRDFYLVARTSLPPEALANALTKTIRAVDPELPLTDLRSMEVRISDSLASRRSTTLMAAVFAATALMLAAIGLYGVMAYTVAQRTREFGVRIALGAQGRDMLRLVLGLGIRLSAIGLAAGLAASLLLTKGLSSLLFGVTADDPLAFAGVASLLGAVALLACCLPARRATRVDPIIALRAD